MPRKPEPPPEPREPPGHLSERSRQLWRDVVPGRVGQAGPLALLQVALESLDRSDAARLAIERDGMTTTKEGGISHPSPLIKIEKDSRALFATVWRSLGLNTQRGINPYGGF